MDERVRATSGLEIVGIAVQETTPDDVQAYADRYELGYTIAFDASADIFDLYKVYALPTQFFIDARRPKILEVVNGPLSPRPRTRCRPHRGVASPKDSPVRRCPDRQLGSNRNRSRSAHERGRPASAARATGR